MTLPLKRPEFDKLCDDTFALIGRGFDSPSARAMLWAIGRQEGRMIHRRQIGGPARGYWQFERGGGVAGVLQHEASREHAHALCANRGVAPSPQAVYQKLEHDDVLACGFARLLLFTDPKPLPKPAPANEQQAWKYYLRCWRPGRPHPESWPDFWAEAMEISR